MFNIALEYDFIDISIITSWADNYILNNEIGVKDYFIIAHEKLAESLLSDKELKKLKTENKISHY